jgi:L-ribulose-5-phosphate 4-epimerase
MYKALKQECYEANMLLPKLGLVLYTFGNVSCADHGLKVFAIKPSGVDYAVLTADMIVVVDFEGKVVEGQLHPSSDTPTHAVLYKNFPEIGGIAHTHSTYATAWAQALRDIPIYGTTHADHLPCGIPCTELMADERIKNNYEVETGLQIVDCFKQKQLKVTEVEMVLVGGHGPFTWGKNAAKSVYNARVLEELAKMTLLTERVNPEVTALKSSIIDKHYNRKHGKNAYYGQS